MSAYLTDDEQAEALKKWWSENGKSVIAGAVLGFGIIFGWQGWQSYQTGQGQAGSALFANMEVQLGTGREQEGLETAKRLISEHGDTVYGTYAAMQMARLSYQKGEKAAARQHLQWAVDNGADPALVSLAQIRLVELLIDMQDIDAAKSVLGSANAPQLSGEVARLRGDLAKSEGDLAAARSAYQEALKAGVDNPGLLEMKLVDLGQAEPAS